MASRGGRARAKKKKKTQHNKISGCRTKITPRSHSSLTLESPGHEHRCEYRSIRASANSTPMISELNTRYLVRENGGGRAEERHGKVLQAAQAPAQRDERMRVPNNSRWLIQPSRSRANAHDQPRSWYGIKLGIRRVAHPVSGRG